jgi:hypothetical protein
MDSNHGDDIACGVCRSPIETTLVFSLKPFLQVILPPAVLFLVLSLTCGYVAYKLSVVSSPDDTGLAGFCIVTMATWWWLLESIRVHYDGRPNSFYMLGAMVMGFLTYNPIAYAGFQIAPFFTAFTLRRLQYPEALGVLLTVAMLAYHYHIIDKLLLSRWPSRHFFHFKVIREGT